MQTVRGGTGILAGGPWEVTGPVARSRRRDATGWGHFRIFRSVSILGREPWVARCTLGVKPGRVA